MNSMGIFNKDFENCSIDRESMFILWLIAEFAELVCTHSLQDRYLQVQLIALNSGVTHIGDDFGRLHHVIGRLENICDKLI